MSREIEENSWSGAPGEKGAVLVLVEILAVVIVIVAGLAIDSTVLATSRAQQRHIAEYMAIESLATYVNTTGSWDTKLEAARKRAEQIAGINVYVGKPLRRNPAPEQISAEGLSMPLGANGRIIPGRWHYLELPSCVGQPTPCPCDAVGNWSGPCFQPLDLDSDSAGVYPKAFRVELSTGENSPIRTLFSHIGGGQDAFELRSRATAALMPRHGMILVDLSRSSHLETHLPYETTGGNPETSYSSESSYQITNLNCPADNTNPCILNNACVIQSGGQPGLFNYIWNIYWASRVDRVAAVDPRMHYRKDYACYATSFLEDGVGKTANYLVDTYLGPTAGSGTYEGPEPLVTMLHGVHHAADLIARQQVPGDQLGAIGFDRTATVNVRTFPLAAPSSAEFGELQYISSIQAHTFPQSHPPQDSTSLESRYEDHLFFPRVDGWANIPEAVRKAVKTLQASPDARTARNFVLLISDGLTNCTENRDCGDTEAKVNASIAEIQSIIDTEFIPNNIQFHFLMIGSTAGPHTLLTKSQINPSSCMADDEARRMEPPLMFVDETTNSSTLAEALAQEPNKFYFGPNALYKAVRATDGIFAPIRNPCSPGVDVSSALNGRCKASAGGRKVSDPNYPIVATDPSYTDADGRLFCDPLGRTRRAQMEDYVEEIIGGPPYILVEGVDRS